MLSFSNVYIYSDQPTSCPTCGARTEILVDLSHSIEKTQIHKCLSRKCEQEFVVQTNFIDIE
jgi:hypothetical protein